ncbi:MAG: UDP-3-O-(3-hydroxymyristoyl)glucosamine N-acyltransferase [Alphaproteobacteria bacterium]
MPEFFRSSPKSVADLAALLSLDVSALGENKPILSGVAALDRAGPNDVAFLENTLYKDALAKTKAGVVLIAAPFASLVPSGTIPFIVAHPHSAFATVASALYPTAAHPGLIFGHNGISPGAAVHPEARLEQGVAIDPGVVIGPGAEVGSGSTIAANSVVGPQVRIGRNCHIGSNVTILSALIGNDVIIHSGTSIGQDGFGFAIGRQGHTKVPQIGRVIIQDHVELGANVTIDRGGIRDTIIGEGSKLDNMVHIAHNVVMGRHCLIAGQVGIAGSSEIGDFVVVGGQVGITGHAHIGSGTQIAGGSAVISSLAAGSKVGGYPARPIKTWFREVAAIARLARGSRGGRNSDSSENETES